MQRLSHRLFLLISPLKLEVSMAEIRVERRRRSMWLKILGTLALLLLIWLTARALQGPKATTVEPVPAGLIGNPAQPHGG
jgi:hypothetical protein